MQQVIQFFKQPYPFFRKKWHAIAYVCICVFSILCFFSTFLNFFRISEEQSLFNLRHFIYFTCAHTLIATICTSIVAYLFPLLFKRYFDAKLWTRGKYFVSAIIVSMAIGMGNSLYWYFVLKPNFHHPETPFYIYFFNNIKMALLIGIPPTIFGYFWFKYYDLHFNLQERTRDHQIADEKLITLSGNTKDSVTLFPGELFYLESVGNYVQVYFRQNGQIVQKALRVTISQMEDALREYPFLVCCHRAFIVNILHINQIKNLKIWLKSLETEIPVSKTYKSNLQKQLTSTGISSQF